MKELYKPFNFRQLGWLPSFFVVMWICGIAWKTIQASSPEQALKTALLVAFWLFLLFGTPLLFHWLFDIRAFDDGDALVLKRRTVTERVPLSQIERVEYVTGFGKPQRVRLHLTQPCAFGQVVTFPVSNESPAPRHSEIADDLHRRSLGKGYEGGRGEVIRPS